MAIQILPTVPKYNFGSELGKSIGQGFQQGSTASLNNIMQLEQEQRQEKVRQKQIAEALKGLQPGASVQDTMAAIAKLPAGSASALSSYLGAMAKGQQEKELLTEQSKLWQNILGGQQQQAQGATPQRATQANQVAPGTPQMPGQGQVANQPSQAQPKQTPTGISQEKADRDWLANITPEQVLQAKAMGLPGADYLGQQVENARKEQKEEREKEAQKPAVKELLMEAGFNEDEANRLSEIYDLPTARELAKSKLTPQPFEKESEKIAGKRVGNFIDHSLAIGDAADEKMRGLSEGYALLKAGGTGFNAMNWLADYLKIPALANPASKGFNAAMKSQYQGIGDIVKGKVSNFEFGVFQDRIATAADSPQSAEILLVSSMMSSQIAQKQRDIVNEKRMKLEAEGKTEGRNFDIEVLNELRPYADMVLHDTNTKIDQILNPTKKKDAYTPQEAKDLFPGLYQ